MSDKIAKVVGFFKNGAPQIQFDGESSASEKEFPFLKSCQPKVDDRVYMKEFANSYIIFDVIYFERGLEPPININKIEGDLEVEGKITSKSFETSGNSTIKGTLYAEGYSYFSRELECKSTLLVRGGSAFKDIVNIDGDIEGYILKVNNKGGAGLEVSSKSGNKTIQASGQINADDSFYTKGWIYAIGTVKGSNIK